MRSFTVTVNERRATSGGAGTASSRISGGQREVVMNNYDIFPEINPASTDSLHFEED
jgi:hypothetical protein